MWHDRYRANRRTMELTEQMIDKAVLAYESSLSLDPQFEASKRDPDLRKRLRRDAMRAAMVAALGEDETNELELFDRAQRSLDARSENVPESTQLPAEGWPSYPAYKLSQLRPDGRLAKLALVLSTEGPKLHLSIPSDDDFKTRISILPLDREQCLELSDALSIGGGRLRNDATTLDKRQLAYFVRAERQLLANREFLARLPLVPVTVEQIRETDKVIQSKPQ